MKRAFCSLAALIVSAYISEANLFVNPGFEIPEATVDYAGSGWTPGGTSPNPTERQWWAARSGNVTTNKGGSAPGWTGGTNDIFVYQDVAVSTGTYTFSIWVRQEEGYNALTNEVRIGWYDANTNLLQFSKSTYLDIPSDDLWHHLFVTDTCTSQTLAFARATYYACFGEPGGGPTAGFFDDADFYQGAHVGTPLSNGSFERSLSEADSYWRASQWHNLPDLGNTNRYAFESWANRSGAWGIGIWGWDVAEPSNSVTFAQNLAPGTGTFSFAVFLNRETNFLLSNALLRIEWFDQTFTNKVCPDTVSSSLVVPTNFLWQEYWVTGTCTSNSLHEARVSLYVDWAENTAPGGSQALKVDDARFLPGAYDGTSLSEDWAYHSAPGLTPSLEQIPGTNLGAFLQVDYASQTSTIYVLSPTDGFALYDGEDGVVGLRTSFQRPENGSFVNTFADMTPVGQVVIDAGSPFHGLPAAGAQTQTLWCTRMEFPRDLNGDIYTTNPITVFYSPYLRTTNAVGGETDRRFLVGSDGLSTNNLIQLFHEAPETRDYAFQLNPPVNAELLDPSFESPASTDFVGSEWFGFGGIGRELWSVREGSRGGYLASWAANEGGVFQDVARTGGTHTFSIWVKRPVGAVLTAFEMKVEWFNSAAQLMFAETNTMVPPADERWHRFCLTSTLPAGESLFTRVVLYSSWDNSTVPFHDATFFDDAEFYSGGFTSVQAFQNGDFETGDPAGGLAGTLWDGVLTGDGGYVGRDNWAARNGSWGGDFQGAQTNLLTYTATLSQALNLSTGTYAFSGWIQVESAILLTNFEMRIEWLKKDLTAVQPATTETLTLPLDNTWHAYSITGTCSDTDLFEVRPLFFAQWDRNLGGGGKAIKIDDVAFGPPGGGDVDGDGLPDWWEELYFGSPTGADPNGNGDADPALNGEEYVADTHPTNGASYFPNLITNRSGFAVLTLLAGPPTTNSRVYDVWWNTNLVTGGWTPMGLNVQGDGNGGPVQLVVTNEGPYRNYLTGVKLP